MLFGVLVIKVRNKKETANPKICSKNKAQNLQKDIFVFLQIPRPFDSITAASIIRKTETPYQ